jgi:hypothetical protein
MAALLMADEWSATAAAAVTGLATIVSGSLGYLLGYRQSRAEERRAEQARRDAQQAKRGETYHSFLDIDRQLPSRLGAGLDITREELEDWLQPFNHCYNAVILLGGEEVSTRARALFDGYVSLYNGLTGGAGKSWPTLEDRQAAWAEHQAPLDEARRALIDAMRRDVFANGDRRPSRAAARRGDP